MGMTNEQRMASALDLIFQNTLNFKDMKFETPELGVETLQGLVIQIGLIAANCLDVNDKNQEKDDMQKAMEASKLAMWADYCTYKEDAQRLDFLQGKLEESVYTGMCVARDSATGRGFRLHETSRNDAAGVRDVREAIDKFMEKSS